MISLPPELIYLIISTAASRKGVESVKNLSLTCSALRGPCQSLLLSHIQVAISYSRIPGSTASPGARLLELLSSSSRIVSYVKRITMFDPEPLWAGENERKLAGALDQFNLTKIEGFALICGDEGKYHLLDESLREVIVRICKSPSLLTISLSSAPLQLLLACGPSLKHLQVEYSFQSNQPDVGAGMPSCRESQVVSLDSLQLGYHPNPVSALQFILRHPQTIRVDRLRTLRLNMSTGEDDEDAWMGSLVKACQNSLKTLKLVPHAYTRDGAESVFRRFPHCPNLTTLDIQVDATGLPRDCLQGTASFLESLSPSNAIEALHLGLEFNIRARRSLTGVWGGIWSAALRRIGNCVTLGFPHLRTVTVEIHTPDPDDIQAIRTWVVEALAIPPETGLLDVA
ncbi:hypothetical protein FA13DRAFT_1821163 [Coprinellus micaceus]|uniref:F-box domain-containing protein n=1 Tax=Coprinellus micaceus TaxID=71717 RepID=A0A4Y7SE19_COPMI|nr:hypothetical protein FA13DRAFT_1821163 [Coprinellus micaceus]